MKICPTNKDGVLFKKINITEGSRATLGNSVGYIYVMKGSMTMLGYPVEYIWTSPRAQGPRWGAP
jgi:hypothetical protein